MNFDEHFRVFRRQLMEQTRDITREFETQFIDWLNAVVKHEGVKLLEDLPPDSDDDIEEPNISDIDNDERHREACAWNILAVGETVRADGTRAGRNDDRATRRQWKLNTVRSIIMPDGSIKPWPETAEEIEAKKRKFAKFRKYRTQIRIPNFPPEESSDSETEPEKSKRPPRPTKKRTPPAKIHKRRPEQDSINDPDSIEEVSSDEWNKNPGEPENTGQDRENNTPGGSGVPILSLTSNDKTKLPTGDSSKPKEVEPNEQPELPCEGNSGTNEMAESRHRPSSVSSEYSGSTASSQSAMSSYSGSSVSNASHPYFRGSISPIPQDERRRRGRTHRQDATLDDSASQCSSFVIVAGDLTMSSLPESFNNEQVSIESENSELEPNKSQRKKNQLALAKKRRTKLNANSTSETDRNTTGTSSAVLGENSSGGKFLDTNIASSSVSASSSGISDETSDGSIGNLAQNLHNFDLDGGAAFTVYPNVLPPTTNFSTIKEEAEDENMSTTSD